MANKEKEWKLYFGSHRRTLTSRDSSVTHYDSLEDCKEAVKEAEKDLLCIGYVVWFAEAIGPDEKKVIIHKGTPCC